MANYEITSGRIPAAIKLVVYGPEGIGKSTFVSKLPGPVLFIDTEGSTSHMDVKRLPAPTSWTMLMDELEYVKRTPGICQTLALDTLDWAEAVCMDHVCTSRHVTGIEDFGYGKGYVYAAEEWGKLLNKLSELVDAGINVACTAHAQMRKFEQPDEMGAYDRWELKLSKKVAPMVKEWADTVLFANYKTIVINVDGKGSEKGKNKAQGGQRVMYATHHPCWDAKNRFGLADEMPFEPCRIAEIFLQREFTPAPTVEQPPKVEVPKAPPVTDMQPIEDDDLPFFDGAEERTKEKAPEAAKPEAQKTAQTAIVPPHLQPLYDLMEANGVTEEQVRKAVSDKGYYPAFTPLSAYDPQFVSGVLVAAWQQVLKMIKG